MRRHPILGGEVLKLVDRSGEAMEYMKLLKRITWVVQFTQVNYGPSQITCVSVKDARRHYKSLSLGVGVTDLRIVRKTTRVTRKVWRCAGWWLLAGQDGRWKYGTTKTFLRDGPFVHTGWDRKILETFRAAETWARKNPRNTH